MYVALYTSSSFPDIKLMFLLAIVLLLSTSEPAQFYISYVALCGMPWSAELELTESNMTDHSLIYNTAKILFANFYYIVMNDSC